MVHSLFRHDSNVDKFFLHWDVDLNESRVHSWISFVVRGNVKELGQEHPLFIPLSLFTCESLILLELQVHANIHLPICIRFPRLKGLKLVGFEISDECWNEQLFSNSPVLEELIMEHCSVNVKFFCISIPTLKLFKITTWRVERNGIQDCVFKVHAPRLVTFSYSGYVAKEFVLSSFPELVEATFHFIHEGNGGEETSRLLRALAHVKCLTVHNITLLAICSAYDLLNNLLTFHNVKVLNVAEVLTSEEGLLLFLLLKAVPNLESLVFEEFMGDKVEENDRDNADGDNDNEDDEADHNNEDVSDAVECGKDDGWTVDIATTGCLFPHLKSVCFEEFAGNPTEIRWVKLILRYAKALQTMTIRYCYDSDFRFVNAKSEKELMDDEIFWCHHCKSMAIVMLLSHLDKV